MTSKVAIVTGASSGIGLTLTQRLVANDYRVVAVSRNVSRSKRLLDGDNLVLVDGDVGQAETAERTVRTAKERFGRLDLLVNNAGIFIAKPFVEYDARDYERLVNTNLAGFFHMTQKALSDLSGGHGHVVNISTSLTVQPIEGVPSSPF